MIDCVASLCHFMRYFMFRTILTLIAASDFTFSDQLDMTTKEDITDNKENSGKGVYPVDVPSVFDESFEHPIEGLLRRFEKWSALLKSLEEYFNSQKSTQNEVINKCHDAARALKKRVLRPSIINAMGRPEVHDKSFWKKQAAKVTLLKEKLQRLDQDFNFDYVQDGGVHKNIICLTDCVEQRAGTTERHLLDLNASISATEELHKDLDSRVKELSDWLSDLAAVAKTKIQAIAAYQKLVTAAEKHKVNRDMTPLAEDDPLVCWLRYYAVREEYLFKINKLKSKCVELQDSCKQYEGSLLGQIKNILREYLDTRKSHNIDVRALFSLHKIPFDDNQEWQTFQNKPTHIATPPFGVCEPREVHFAGEDHEKAKPLAQANLLLLRSFPWSLRSKKEYKRYVVTQKGYLIKASNQLDDTNPKRAFRLQECAIIRCDTKNGLAQFRIQGPNCCRSLADRRSIWTFCGSEQEVSAMLTAIQAQMPKNPYPLGMLTYRL
jgi:hypothetical protein